jgi:hypothetical protein
VSGERVRVLALRMCLCRSFKPARCANPCGPCLRDARDALRELAALDLDDMARSVRLRRECRP